MDMLPQLIGDESIPSRLQRTKRTRSRARSALVKETLSQLSVEKALVFSCPSPEVLNAFRVHLLVRGAGKVRTRAKGLRLWVWARADQPRLF